MASLLFGRTRKPSLSSKHKSSAVAISILAELDKEDASSKSPAQLEHILFEYEKNLGTLLASLNPSSAAHAASNQAQPSYTAEERVYISKSIETYMAKAESIKAILVVKKTQRKSQQHHYRMSDAKNNEREEQVRRNSLQDETRRRLSEAKLEDANNRRRASSSSGHSAAAFSASTRPPAHHGAHQHATTTTTTHHRQQPHPSSTARRMSTTRPSATRVPQQQQQSRGHGAAPQTSKYNDLEKMILEEVLMEPPQTSWSDIAGLADAKTALQETVILPTLRPDIFTGLRAPPKGVLLFGPPGTGKTMIARACASESGFRFFAVSASSLTSKWVGEGEKMMKALFKVAHDFAPSVVFMDEIDSVLSKRKSTGEHEASRRLKTEFLVQIDGINSSANDPDHNVLVIGATNLPFDLDDAVLRRFGRRVYVPLPDAAARKQIFQDLLAKNTNNLSSSQLDRLVQGTANFSASDITNLSKEASMGPLRSISMRSLANMDPTKIPAISYDHFETALRATQPSVSQELLDKYVEYIQ
jgi:SpoVK/Ycf46/Vps4 family AAA+-type ATPase